MADESEDVGGISVSISATDNLLEARLNAANAKIDAWVKQATERATVQIKAVWAGGTGGPSGAAARPPAAPPPPQIRFGRPGGATASENAAFERAIAQQLASTKTKAVQTANIAAQQITVTAEKAITNLPPVNLQIDRTAFKAELNAILEDLRAFHEEAKQYTNLRVGATGGGGKGRGRTKVTAANGGEDEEESSLENPPRIKKVDQLERQRIRERQGRDQSAIAFDRREQRLFTQRQREEARARVASGRLRAPANTILDESNPNAQAGAGANSVTIIGSPAEIASRGRGGGGVVSSGVNAAIASGAAVQPRRPVAPIDAIERQRRSQLRDLEEFGRGRGGATGLTDEDYARRAEQRIAVSESVSAARGRTARTTASSFGGQFLFGAPARQQAEAAARQAQAEQNLGLARRRLNDPTIIRNAVAYRNAVREQAAAEDTLAKATAKVQSLGGPGTALRSLAAVTVAGAAFGLALKGIDVALAVVGQGLAPVIEQTTGYAGVASKLTGTLSDQARANDNNFTLTTKLAAAQSGLSQGAQQYITPLIAQRTETEAGNKAFANLIDNLKAYHAIRQQNANLPPGVDAQLFQDVTGLGGTGIGGTASTIELLKDRINEIGQTVAGPSPISAASSTGLGLIGGGLGASLTGGGPPAQIGATELANNQAELQRNFDVFNANLTSAGDTTQKFTVGINDGVDALQKSLLPGAKELGDALAKKGAGVTGVTSSADIVKLLQNLTRSTTPFGVVEREQLAFQQSKPATDLAVELLQKQQAFARPAIIDTIGREIGDALNRSLPTNAAIANLAAPPVPVGTGIGGGAFSGAAEQKQIKAGIQESIGLQQQLNDYYKQGQQVISDTYRPSIAKNLGEGVAQAFDKALADVTATGQAIAKIQAQSANEQAVQQTKEYNFQLFIARRTLTDISGLTGHNFGVGQSELGLLEKQNLALSRQGQLLSFALAQRQINFQVAQAGFQAPGRTPEEIAANVAEAKYEASFAQKQLNISKREFQNQVKIVDISNLRQGVDLAKQIALLVSGRQVTIDVAINNEKLQKQLAIQQQQVARVATYTSAVDKFAQNAISEMGAVEAAFGHALLQGGKDATLALYGFVHDFTSMLSGTYKPAGNGGYVGGGITPGGTKNAGGGLYNTLGPTQIGSGIAGEIKGETVAILSNPRSVSGSGGGNVIFAGPITVRSNADIDEIARKVMKSMGRTASNLGLRTVG